MHYSKQLLKMPLQSIQSANPVSLFEELSVQVRKHFCIVVFSTGQANKTKGAGYFLCPPVLLFFSFVCFLTRITSLKMAECCLCPGFISQSKCPFPSRYNSHSSTVRFLQVNMSSLFSSTWIIASFHFMVHRGLMCEPVTKAFAGQCTVTCFRQTISAAT